MKMMRRNNNNNKLHLYLTCAIFQSINSKLKSLSIEALSISYLNGLRYDKLKVKNKEEA